MQKETERGAQVATSGKPDSIERLSSVYLSYVF